MRLIRTEYTDSENFDSVEVYQLSADNYGKLNAIGIHLLEPSAHELECNIDHAAANGFPAIYVYGGIQAD